MLISYKCRIFFLRYTTIFITIVQWLTACQMRFKSQFLSWHEWSQFRWTPSSRTSSPQLKFSSMGQGRAWGKHTESRGLSSFLGGKGTWGSKTLTPKGHFYLGQKQKQNKNTGLLDLLLEVRDNAIYVVCTLAVYGVSSVKGCKWVH